MGMKFRLVAQPIFKIVLENKILDSCVYSKQLSTYVESVITRIFIWHPCALSGSVSTQHGSYTHPPPMNCPHCNSTHTTQLRRTTELGYPVFRCRERKRTSNEWHSLRNTLRCVARSGITLCVSVKTGHRFVSVPLTLAHFRPST